MASTPFKAKNGLDVAGNIILTGSITGITSASASGQITSTLATGTAPFVVASTTQVANLNAQTSGTSTNIAGGTLGQLHYQTGVGTTGFVAVGSAGQLLRSAGAALPVFSTSTFADTYAVSTILYASASNTITGLVTANNGVLITSAGGVPSISSILPSGLTIAGALVSVSSTVTAAGTTQGTATALTSDRNAVTTVAAGAGVVLQATVVGKTVVVANKGANALLVYPATSSQIDALGVNVGYSLAVGAVMLFYASTSTLWYSDAAPSSGGSGMTWSTITSANVTTAVTNTGYLMRTGGTLRTVTLPASAPAGFYCSVNADAGQVRIVSNGNIIDQVGSGNDLLMPANSTVTLVAATTGALEVLYGTTLTATGGGRNTSSVAVNTTAAAAAASTDYIYLTSGTTTITLPTAVANSNKYTVKNIGSGVVTIATTSSQTIDGSTSATLPASLNTSLDLISDGTNWYII